MSQPFPPNLQDIIKYKPKELRNWNLERMFTPKTCQMSYFTCYMSHVTCHKSCVMCHMSHFFLTEWWRFLVEGRLSTGPTPSSFRTNAVTLEKNSVLIRTNPIILRTFQSWWHASFDNILVLMTFNFGLLFIFDKTSLLVTFQL